MNPAINVFIKHQNQNIPSWNIQPHCVSYTACRWKFDRNYGKIAALRSLTSCTVGQAFINYQSELYTVHHCIIEQFRRHIDTKKMVEGAEFQIICQQLIFLSSLSLTTNTAPSTISRHQCEIWMVIKKETINGLVIRFRPCLSCQWSFVPVVSN